MLNPNVKSSCNKRGWIILTKTWKCEWYYKCSQIRYAFQSTTCEVKNRSRNNALTDVITQLKICRQKILGPTSTSALRSSGKNGGSKKLKKLSFITHFVTVHTDPLDLCLYFFSTVFTVIFFPAFQLIMQP